MSCKCSKPCDQYHGWECSVSGGECMFLFPDSKACAEKYGEGPDADYGKCEECTDFYIEDGQRCCKEGTPKFINNEYVVDKYIEDDVLCCGGFHENNF
jgi:hypothetical protein